MRKIAIRCSLAVALLVSLAATVAAAPDGSASTPVKKVLGAGQLGDNLLKADGWRAYETGFERQDGVLFCDNGEDAAARRGAGQTVVLNQTRPLPIVASAWSKAAGVGGSPDADYSLYLDLIYTDGTPLWGQTASFSVGTHDWERREVVVLPEKPVKSLTVYVLLRGHAGRAWFRDAELRQARPEAGAVMFDGLAVVPQGPAAEGYQLRDVAAGGDFVRLEREALGLRLESKQSNQGDASFFDVTLSDTTGKDRAVTLVYAIPLDPVGLRWLEDARRSSAVEPGGEYMRFSRFSAGANGRLSKYPFAAVVGAAAVAGPERGTALGIDMAWPAFFRVGYNAASGELFLAWDLGLTPEQPSAHLRFCRFGFDPKWQFRAALARYYELFPDQFRCRTPEQGLWMPFARISKVEGWQDFGFKFKEGNDETRWDDEHGVLTFRYTEPMTWWMPMAKGTPRTLQEAVAQATRMAADEKGDRRARALFTSGFYDESGSLVARLLTEPWNDGAVWSMNSMPGIAGDYTDFNLKWSPAVRERLYGPPRQGDLDGEYVDSSEGYVTAELDFRRDHFAAARTPLTFSLEGRRPAIFRGLVAFEYVRAIAADVHAMGKFMMANGAPDRLPWLVPMLDVCGTETDWNPGGSWQPMSDADLLYRRSLCRGKPFCFLMNTAFERLPPERVEKYMKRCLAYGMFPGFFSHNASEGAYFTRPELYNRDRPLFRKNVPLCKLVAEAGWEPVTGAASSDPRVYVERFGDRYLTVFNDSSERRTVEIALDPPTPAGQRETRELVGGGSITWRDGRASLTLEGEDVAVIELK
jgi:hypothetical protein